MAYAGVCLFLGILYIFWGLVGGDREIPVDRGITVNGNTMIWIGVIFLVIAAIVGITCSPKDYTHY